VIQSLSSTRFAGSMKSDIKTWCPITMQPLTWQRILITSTLTMYHISKMRMQMHWRLSLLHWPSQPEPHRECLSTVVTCTITKSPLNTVKLKEKTFKLKRFLRLQQVSSLGTDNSLTLISSCTIYCLTTHHKEATTIRRKAHSILLQYDHTNIVSSLE